MRASSFALNSWLAAGWLTDHGTRSGRRLVDLHEALLVAGLRNGPECIPAELAEFPDRAPRPAGTPSPDPCLARVGGWAGTLGTLSQKGLTMVVERFHESGYTCAEISAGVARLSAGQLPRRG